MRARTLTRRQFLAVSGSSAAALTLAGCGGGGYGYPIEVGVGVGIGFPIYYWKTVHLEADPQGTLYSLDPAARSVSRLAPDGTPRWTTPPDSLGMPAGIAFAPDGRAYVADLGRHEIRVLDPKGAEIGRIGAFGEGSGEFRVPHDVVMDARGWLYVCDSHNHRIQVMDVDGNFVDALGYQGSGEGALSAPCAMALDAAGSLHVVDAGNARVVVFDRNGRFSRVYAQAGVGRLVQPRDIVIDPAGTRYVVDGVAQCVQSFDAMLESPGACLTPALADGRSFVPLRASLNPAGGLFLMGQPL